MSTIAFTYDTTFSEYINTRLNDDGEVILTPESLASMNVTDWDYNGSITDDDEVATIDNSDATDRYIDETISVDQQTAGGTYLWRAMVKITEALGAKADTLAVYGRIRHHDLTIESGKATQLPTGKFNWAQFSLTISSLAGDTIEYVYPSLRARNRVCNVQFKRPEVIDLSDTSTAASYGEAYSKPECIYEPVTLETPAGSLAPSLMPFIYSELDNLKLKASLEFSEEFLLQFPYLICEPPGGGASKLEPREEIVTDAIKSTVKIFGYVAMGAEEPENLPTLSAMQSIVDDIAAAGWYGVFLDRFGYDWEETRTRQNTMVDYIHAAGLVPFANGWAIDDVLGDDVDVDHNPGGVATTLTTDDWVLLEGFLFIGGDYTSDVYATSAMERYNKAMDYSDSLGVKVCAYADKRDDITDTDALDDAKVAYALAAAYGFDGFWYAAASDHELDYQNPNINLGSSLTTALDQLAPYWYVAETDKYILVFDVSEYSPMRMTAYDKGKIRNLPSTPGSFEYSADLDTWSATRSSTSKWIREKLTFS